ncbi:MAG TPA: O-methyltransferase [Gemmatimonadales bacterium]|nr:O-methyltransferase [Gemmatimonadales bacterium]
MDERLLQYASRLFAVEDPVLARIRARHAEAALPAIHISPDEGKLIAVLIAAIGAVRVLELGALGGYSGVWIARALAPGGKLITVEREPRHAELARRAYSEAGVGDRVEVREGAALDVLPTLTPGFDAVFVDADKEPLPQYYAWSMKLLRPGGLLLVDNAFYSGAVLDATDDSGGARGVRALNDLAAADPALRATIVPIRDGLLVGVKSRG